MSVERLFLRFYLTKVMLKRYLSGRFVKNKEQPLKNMPSVDAIANPFLESIIDRHVNTGYISESLNSILSLKLYDSTVCWNEYYMQIFSSKNF